MKTNDSTTFTGQRYQVLIVRETHPAGGDNGHHARFFDSRGEAEAFACSEMTKGHESATVFQAYDSKTGLKLRRILKLTRDFSMEAEEVAYTVHVSDGGSDCQFTVTGGKISSVEREGGMPVRELFAKCRLAADSAEDIKKAVEAVWNDGSETEYTATVEDAE